MSALQIEMFPCLQDNYGFLLHDPAAGVTATVDTPAAAAIEQALERTGWSLDLILNTHHHWDHAGGNLELKAHTGCRVLGAESDRERLPGLDQGLADGEEFRLGTRPVRVYATPGHTRSHVVYHFYEDQAAFVGDTLFAMGCGRLFEGSAEQMWASLQKLMRQLPDDTRIYCAHEYTQNNARFALTVEPGNLELVARAQAVDRLRAQHQPTVPTTMALEKATNPFLRPDSENLQDTLGMTGAPLVEVFAATRQRKDQF